jgi:ATP-binding cassette subfamily B protein
MVAKFYGKSFSLQSLRKRSYISRRGVSLLGISDAAEKIGFRTLGTRIGWDQLKKEAPLPAIVHWQQSHFIVLYKISGDTVYIADPAIGLITYTKEEFLEGWISHRTNSEDKGVCLLLETTPIFFSQKEENQSKRHLGFLLNYLKPHRKFINQLLIAFLAGSLFQLIFPFLTQSIVDIGINTRDLSFIYIILFAQMALYIGKTTVDFIRSWILLHISTRINISLISDFLIKLMKLPIGFFDIKSIGDIMQRIEDHHRIENFLTTSTLNILFSFFNLIIFAFILLYYNYKIFLIFIIGSTMYITWVLLFMKKRRSLDYKRFSQLSTEQSKLYQLITGMQEIKLNNSEKQKRWEWERIQAKLFKLNIKTLSLKQYQQSGTVFINETKNILITFFSASLVIKGEITLGAMLAIQYIIGQLNSPIEQLISFVHAAQDAKISVERLNEIHNKEDEEQTIENKTNIIPHEKNILINNLSFKYEGPHSPSVLKQLNLSIPQNKITAIVGASGSGKTTLLKLLLGFYKPNEGEIRVNKNLNLNNINQHLWRDMCGVVMQEGFIFSDSIIQNIAVGEEMPNMDDLFKAVETANIKDFIESLPLGYNTIIGQEGHGLSQGQKQRILIARAVYKNPEYLFLDEATNALDAHNEKMIMENLNTFFKGRTVVIVAHRLSTVKNADQIIVLDKGKIAESGSHEELTKQKGLYYTLVKNQLELGN